MLRGCQGAPLLFQTGELYNYNTFHFDKSSVADNLTWEDGRPIDMTWMVSQLYFCSVRWNMAALLYCTIQLSTSNFRCQKLEREKKYITSVLPKFGSFLSNPGKSILLFIRVSWSQICSSSYYWPKFTKWLHLKTIHSWPPHAKNSKAPGMEWHSLSSSFSRSPSWNKGVGTKLSD